jgi:ABC-2 type transport system permease protein
MVAGALTGRRGTAIGPGTALAAASYLISSLAPVVSWIGPTRYASLFYWSVGNSQISQGVSPGGFVVLTVTGLCALAAAVLAFRRLEIH